jgi:selenide,water dikinase
MVSGLSKAERADPCVLVGTETGDDAGVYSLRSDLALVNTVDFITPVLDDPYMFGQIAAANSISDVYAMGGRPLTALNIMLLPRKVDPEVAGEILQGGLDTMREAGAALIGGHTVLSEELFYGLSVTGLVHPERVVRNVGLRAGDVLLLTKALGTGLFINGYRKGVVSDERLRQVCKQMIALNRDASELMVHHHASAATDVTGFGLAGHVLGMAIGSHATVRLSLGAIPVLHDALELMRKGVTTGSTAPNRKYSITYVRRVGRLPEGVEEILYDPQTSGGMLIAMSAADERAFADALAQRGGHAWRIGEVVTAGAKEPPALELVP